MMISDETRKEGFEIFKKGLVRRLSPTHFVAKTQSVDTWQLMSSRTDIGVVIANFPMPLVCTHTLLCFNGLQRGYNQIVMSRLA